MTLFGCDTSNNDFSHPAQVAPLVNAMAAQGFSWLEAKVSQGSGFHDAYWAPTQDACAHVGFPLIGYHYLDTSDPAAQAQCFVNNGGGTVAMLDVEAGSGDINNFWNVVNAFNAAGVQIALSYIPDWYFQRMGSPDLSQVPGLISSAYPNSNSDLASRLYANGGGDTGEGWNAYGNCQPAIWQFTDAADVGGFHLDCNAFRGTPAQLTTLLQGK
jgi:lysozyme